MIMKNILITTIKMKSVLTFAFAVSILFVSCVQDDDFTVPNSLGDEENQGLVEIMQEIDNGTLTEISISSLIDLFGGEPELIESNIVVKGYVSSSDQTGNFFREFYMQDSPDNPTAGIGVLLSQVDSYNQFNIGREVYIKLNGLYIGENSSDVVSIGGRIEEENLDEMTANQIPLHVFRSPNTFTIVPLSLDPSEVNSSHLGVFVTLENVQFPLNLEGETFVDPFDDFDTQRSLIGCESGASIPMETSAFADFDKTPLPFGRGSISGVITQSFRGREIVIVLNSIDDIEFNQNRCDPVFEEDFNDGLIGWEVTNTVGTQSWRASGFGGVSYARGSAFSSGSIVQMVSWLISTPINFDAQNGEQMILQIGDAFSNGQPLKAYYSTDYSAGQDPDTATWVEIGAAEIDALEDNGGFYDNNYEQTAPIDMSGISGNAVIAFVYDSNNATVSTNIDISFIKIFVP
jgi:hypothetical protein